MTEIRIGISSCLLGNQVRWNGQHKLDHFIVETLGKYVQFVPVCPEVECGFGVPREPFRLVGEIDAPHLVTVRTQFDYTERMLTWACKRVAALEKENLSGFIFKSDSPSSGMERVKVYNAKGGSEKKGVGLFARAFMEHFPLLPVEDEGRLHDPKLRENFIEAIFTFHRWRDLLEEKTVAKLVDFHTRHKLLLLSHSPRHYRMMGKLVADPKKLSLSELYEEYQRCLLEALRLKTTFRKHLNVLLHILGYFKKELSADEKKELLEIFEHYRREQIPLIVPISLINHYVRKYDQAYLKQQYYLCPHPLELKLRNHV